MIEARLAALLLLLVAAAPAAAGEADWPRYAARFVDESGRVIDTGNGGVSHSEGQGWGLLLAVAHGDRQRFERILGWTRRNLAVRGDRLHAWRWLPGAADPTPDRNNASDGDLYIAWALLRAAERWGVPAWRADAEAILRDLQRCCIVPLAGCSVLLPGAAGFAGGDRLVVNLSYWVFPAMAAFAEAFDAPGWRRLADCGRTLLRRARFGRWGLPADWTRLAPDGAASLPADFPPRFGWDALRIPLLLAWGGVDDPGLYAPFVRLRASLGDRPTPPAWVDLRDDRLADEPGGDVLPVMLDIAGWWHGRARRAGEPPRMPAFERQRDYYGATLLLLARLAIAEGGRR